MKKLILLPLLFLSFVHAETIPCKVVEIIDGNNITCLTDPKELVKVRLHGIDAPELEQPYGEEAKQALLDIILTRNSIVLIERVKETKDQIIGRVSDLPIRMCAGIGDGTGMDTSYEMLPTKDDINTLMIKLGYAWHSPFDTNNTKYKQEQEEAKKAKLGLWADPNPVPPWEWRKQNKGK